MQTSNVSDLKTRLKEKMEADRQQTESLITEQLQQLARNLKASAKKEQISTEKNMVTGFKDLRKEITAEIEATEETMDLSQIESDINQAKERVKQTVKAMRKAWLWIIAMMIFFLIIIFGGLLGLDMFWTNQLAMTRAEIAKEKETLELIKQKTLGIEILTVEGETFVMFSPRYQIEKRQNGDYKPYTLGKREGVAISRR